MTTPLLPDTATVDTFGGVFANEDGVVDPTTEVDASYINRLITQAVMASYTQPRAWARCTVSGGVITLAAHGAVWGDTAPVAPTAARTSAGLYTLTWATSYDDLQDTPESHSTNVRAVVGVSAYNSTSFIAPTAAATAANVITVRTWDDAGAAADCTEFTVTWL